MKQEIHPEYISAAKVNCSCGNSWVTGSTKAEINVNICSACHPFYTGEQRIIDSVGRVERFVKRLESRQSAAARQQIESQAREEADVAGRRARARGDDPEEAAAEVLSRYEIEEEKPLPPSESGEPDIASTDYRRTGNPRVSYKWLNGNRARFELHVEPTGYTLEGFRLGKQFAVVFDGKMYPFRTMLMCRQFACNCADGKPSEMVEDPGRESWVEPKGMEIPTEHLTEEA